MENNNKNEDYLLEDAFEIQLIRKTTVLNVESGLVGLDVNCNLVEDVLGIISGLDLDPVSPVIDTAANGLALSRRINAVTIQGLVPDGPAHSNEEICVGKVFLHE